MLSTSTAMKSNSKGAFEGTLCSVSIVLLYERKGVK